jgi:hypothetical protein
MRRIAVLFLFLFSCSKIEQENPLSFLADRDTIAVKKKEPVKKDTVLFAAVAVKEDTARIEKPQKTLDTLKTDTLKKEKEMEPKPEVKNIVNTRKPEVKEIKTQPKPQKEQEVKLFVFDDKYYPVTREDAKNYAFECYKKAKGMSNIDSMKIVAKKGLSTFENASLYYLSAKGFAYDKNYLSATNYCKTAISRNDYWGNERDETIKLLIDCMQKTYEKTPSDLLYSQIEKYKEMVK